MTSLIDRSIVCCYLLPITRYGYPPPAEQTDQYLHEMKALGFRSVELEGIREAHLETVYTHKDAILAQVQDLDLEVPYFCVVLPGLSDPSRAVRTHALGLLERGCEVAALLGAQGVLDNAPLPPYRFPEDLPVVRHFDEDVLRNAPLPPDLDWTSYWNNLVDTYRQACDISASYGLTYQIHPCLGALASTTDGFLNFYNAIGRANLRFNLDTANLFMLKDPLPLALRRLEGLVDYIHLSDNRGTRLEHLVPGDGNIAWEVFFETLSQINYDGLIGLDIGGPESGIADLDRAYLRAAQWLSQRWP